MDTQISVIIVCLSLAVGARGASTKDSILLARQLMGQQFYIEEMTRSAGHSGIINMRQRGEGTRPYHGTSHADDYTMASTHDHPDFINTCGMGEITAVLNGVHFKTRHNDYLLVRRGNNGSGFDHTEPIPYPSVPCSVLSKKTVTEQITEMRKYFDNFQRQEMHHPDKDYKPYFKAHLCYMQGAWTKSKPDEIQEAFFSERHLYNAHSWDDLFQKHRYESSSGTKENLENFAYMPTTVWEVHDDGTIEYAQWNYKMLCHQLNDDLPLNRLRGVDELKTQVSLQISYEEALGKRNARFQVNPVDSDIWVDQATKWGLLDQMMEQIAGPDGYGAKLEDNAFGNVIKPFNASENDNTPLNTAYFHRWFQNKDAGAMGVKVRHRGMHDEHMWAAMTTQKNVMPSRMETCHPSKPGQGKKICKTLLQRWVYAIPMEIIYTTPLHNWNPYNIAYRGLDSTPAGQSIYKGPHDKPRDGRNHPDLAYNGTNSAKYYRTPYEFYQEPGEVDVDPADTPNDYTHVLNKTGHVHKVRASGIRTFMPSIHDVGRIRQRFPIHPIHGEGSSVWRELSALKKIVSDLRDCLSGTCHLSGIPPQQLKLGPSDPAYGSHTHLLQLNPSDLMHLAEDPNNTVKVVTEEKNGHTHTLVIARHGSSGDYAYSWTTCGGQAECHDGHPHELIDLSTYR